MMAWIEASKEGTICWTPSLLTSVSIGSRSVTEECYRLLSNGQLERTTQIKGHADWGSGNLALAVHKIMEDSLCHILNVLSQYVTLVQ